MGCLNVTISVLKDDEGLVYLYSSDPLQLYSQDGYALTTGHPSGGIEVSISPVCSV